MKRRVWILWLTMLLLAGCGVQQLDADLPDEGAASAEVLVLPVEDGAELGQGETAVALTITDGDGAQTRVTVYTDQTTLGEALEEVGLIEGEESGFGLYVKTVNGITADYDTDKTYWAFYVNGQYAAVGVDQTELAPGDAYELRVERG